MTVACVVVVVQGKKDERGGKMPLNLAKTSAAKLAALKVFLLEI